MALEEKEGETELKEESKEPDSKIDNQKDNGSTESNKQVTEKDNDEISNQPDGEANNDDKEPVKMDEDVKPDTKTTENDTTPSEIKEAKEEQKPDSDDWKVEASDDDGEEDEECAAKRKKGIWEPPLDVIVKLYEELDKKGVLELKWKCPGRKDLAEERREQEKAKEVVTETLVVPEEKEEEPTAFDDFEEDSTMVKITPRRTTGSGKAQGSGRKRTAKMESILGNMIRHQKIDQEMEKGANDTEIDPMPKSDITPRRVGKIHIRNNIDS